MKHRNLGKFLVAAATISMAVSPITALANEVPFDEGEVATTAVDAKALLNDAITYADELVDSVNADNSHIVKKVKDNFNAKLAAAKEVQDNPDATVDEINAAWSDLIDACHYLEFIGDPTELGELYNEVKDYKESDFESGWEDFKNALDKANEVLNNPNALQEEIEAAKDALKTAKDNLKPVTPAEVDKTELKAAIDEGNEIKNDGYTKDSWDAFQNALKDAQTVYDDENADQNAVDKATTDLRKAIKGLTKESDKADKTELEKALDAHKNLNENAPTKSATLTEESYNAFKEAYKKGQEVFDNPDATQAEVDKATSDLHNAYADLEQNLFRMYNRHTGEHLFTTDPDEYAYNTKLGWDAEGVAWITPKDGEAMTRMYNPNSSEHHYTKNPKEIAGLEKLGWTNEGPKWNSETKEKGIPVHRMYNINARNNPKTIAGGHHYTLEDKERDYLISIGWTWENNEADLFYAKKAAKR